jgi:hypothetical protein
MIQSLLGTEKRSMRRRKRKGVSVCMSRTKQAIKQKEGMWTMSEMNRSRKSQGKWGSPQRVNRVQREKRRVVVVRMYMQEREDGAGWMRKDETTSTQGCTMQKRS